MLLRLTEHLRSFPFPATADWPDGVFHQSVFDRNGLTLLLFAPRGTDRQSPHDRDELYFVVAGHATFVMQDEEPVAVAPGDVIEIAAGRSHRFEDMTGDFATWVVFFGPPKATTEKGRNDAQH